jgi:predicted RND superfamily exporter protein
MDVKVAIYEAGLSRFRPIILTSITTIAGLYPLIWESDFQAQFLIPMAVSVAYGVLFGTLFILFFFPLLVLFFNDMKRAVWYMWYGKKPSMLSVESAIIDMKREKEMGAQKMENIEKE